MCVYVCVCVCVCVCRCVCACLYETHTHTLCMILCVFSCNDPVIVQCYRVSSEYYCMYTSSMFVKFNSFLLSHH